MIYAIGNMFTQRHGTSRIEVIGIDFVGTLCALLIHESITLYASECLIKSDPIPSRSQAHLSIRPISHRSHSEVYYLFLLVSYYEWHW